MARPLAIAVSLSGRLTPPANGNTFSPVKTTNPATLAPTGKSRAARPSSRRSLRGLPLPQVFLSAFLAATATDLPAETKPAGNANAPESADASKPLPDFVDNSTLPCFPPVTSQGPTGACSIFAAMYYQMTHMSGLANGYDNKTSKSNVLSPNWTMNFGVGGVGCYDLSRKNGCASMEDIPFVPDAKLWNTDPRVWARALKHRVDKNGSIGNVDTPEGFHKMKELLSKGYVLYFDTWIGSFQFKRAGDDPSTDKDDPWVGKNVIYGVDNYVAGHALAIVGYNDHMWVDINGNGKVEPAEKGTIKIVNSWGGAYEDHGFTYVCYDALSQKSKVEGVPKNRRDGSVFNYNTAYWVTFKPDYYPRLLAKITVNTSKRNQLKVQLGYSPVTGEKPEYLWDSYLLNKNSDAKGFDGSDSATDGTFVLDFTDLITDHKLENTGTGRWYVSVTDSEADGSPVILKDFSLIDYITRKKMKSSLEFPMSADGTTAHAWVDYSLKLPDDRKPPSVPRNLTVQKFFMNTATLSWEPSRDNVAIKHYKVFRNGKPYMTTEKTTITETNLPLDRTYTYTVAAIDTLNNMSAPGNTATVRVTKSATFDTDATYKLVNKKSGKALSVAQGTFQPGVPFVQYNFSNQGMQQMNLSDAGDGSYRIHTKQKELLVQVDFGALADGTKVCLWSDNGSDSCKWIMIPSGNDTYAIANKASGKVLAVVGGSTEEAAMTEQTTFTKDDSQLWLIKDVAK